MKRIAALLLAIWMTVSLAGCSGRSREAEPPEDEGAAALLRTLRRIDATDFPVDSEFAEGTPTRYQLAVALQEAAETEVDAATGAAAGLEPERGGFWTRSAHLEGTAEGFAPEDLWIEMTCGMTEDLVRVTSHRGAESAVCYISGTALYELLRHWGDRELTINEGDYATFREPVDRAIEKLYRQEKAKGQPYTGWEVTGFQWIASYTDESDWSTIHVYAVDYVMLTDDPYAVRWSGAMCLDSEGRVENVGDFGRLAARWWWWGERYETAALGRLRDEATEFEEARDALNEENPRE